MRTAQHPLDKYAMQTITVGGLPVNFQRTVRVPEGKLNSLPAGLGSFPIYRVSDFRQGCPETWRAEGYFMPMNPQEAMWLNFSGSYQNPRAAIIAAGNINAITGKPFDGGYLQAEKHESGTLDIKLETPQNYVVVPPQPWIDGWKAEDGKVYQFVAAEMGSGQTIEGQITGEEKVGGIQIITFAPIPGKKLPRIERPYEHIVAGEWPGSGCFGSFADSSMLKGMGGVEMFCCAADSEPTMKSMRGVGSIRSMGLGRGAEINQKIYPDPYGLEIWQATPAGVDVLYLVSSEDFLQITGHAAPPTPVTIEKYEEQKLPWFALGDKHFMDQAGSDIFAKLKPVTTGKKAE